ncbi:MAG: choice-of-anchor L domain-containing protein [Bacteroidetes bacterium]|nr:choice-of-anchor L domain-containing protein [Bacteroidota bacterium]
MIRKDTTIFFFPVLKTFLGMFQSLFSCHRLLLCLVFLFFLKNSSAQLTLNPAVTPLQLVQTIVGTGYTVSNIKLNCPNGAIGTFTNVSSNIGITDGILLTTGSINIANGVNNKTSAGVNNGASGDFDLDKLSGATTYDGCALEFDLVPACDSLRINYVFGSEEYPEYVNKQFNDVFAFYISGPGIVGMQNIALVPGTTSPVSINNINAGKNSQYFVNNSNGSTIQYDGFTRPLTARAKVIPCETYHLKIVIADVLDGIFDSGVFIKGNALECSPISYNDIASNSNAVKNCSNGSFTFCRTGDITKPFLVKYTVGGTAVKGVDYVALPDSIIIPPNQKCAKVNLVPIPNGNTGVRTVKIIYQYGYCPRYDTITLSITEPLPIDAGPDVAICSSDSTKIGINPLPNTNYSWQPTTGLSNSSISNPMVSLVNNTNADIIVKYVLSATNQQIGTCVLKDSLYVTVKPLPKAIFSIPANYCVGANISFTDNSTATSGKTIASWYWNFGNNLFDNIQNPIIKYTVAGTFTVSLKVTDNSGCTANTMQTITVWPTPIVNFSVQSACQGDSVRFINSSTVPNGGKILQSIWNFGDGTPLISGTSPSHVYPATSTTFTVQLIATSDKNCVSTAQKTVNIYPQPKADFTSASVCMFDIMRFYNNSTGDKNSWNFGDGTTSILRNPTHQFATSGAHTIKLISTTNYGCIDSITKTFVVYDKPKFDFTASDTAGCPILCSTFQTIIIPGSDTIVSWNWSFSTGDIAKGGKAYYCYDKNGKYSPMLVATTNHGCSDTVVKQYYVNVYPQPNADFLVNPVALSSFDPIAQISNTSTPDAVKWWWNFGDGNTSTGQNPGSHKYSADNGEYRITLKVQNSYGCVDSTFHRVVMRDESAVYIANAFTPNGDDINEEFRPYGCGIYPKANYEFLIFDRWGMLIFRSTDLNVGWNGRLKGEICQQDVYVYKVSFTDKNDGTLIKKMKGIVTLIR